jgi:hypothetical protein
MNGFIVVLSHSLMAGAVVLSEFLLLKLGDTSYLVLSSLFFYIYLFVFILVCAYLIIGLYRINK